LHRSSHKQFLGRSKLEEQPYQFQIQAWNSYALFTPYFARLSTIVCLSFN
jgi:hypothetical protein